MAFSRSGELGLVGGPTQPRSVQTAAFPYLLLITFRIRARELNVAKRQVSPYNNEAD